MITKINVKKTEYKSFLEAVEFYGDIKPTGQKEDHGHYERIEVEHKDCERLGAFCFYWGQIFGMELGK